jgi:hypothetical protein
MKNLIISMISMISIAFMVSCTTEIEIPQLKFSDKKEVLWDGCYSRDFYKPVVGHTLDVDINAFNNHSKYNINGILDVNNDGNDDLFVTEYGKEKGLHYFLLSNGDGTFYEPENFIEGDNTRIHIRNISIGDFNNDKKLDIFGFTSGRTEAENRRGERGGEENIIFLSRGNKYVAKAPPNIKIKEYGHGGDSADIDQDGDIDVYVPQENREDKNYFLINDGNGNFKLDASHKRIGSSLELQGLVQAQFEDLNNDKYPDLVLLTLDGNKAITIVFNDKKGNFQSKNAIVIGNHYAELIEGYRNGRLTSVVNFYDYDNDGFKDLFVGQHTVMLDTNRIGYWDNNYILVLKNLKGKKFIDVTNKVIPEQRVNLNRNYNTGYSQYIEFEDLNNDGLKDIIVATDNPKRRLIKSQPSSHGWLYSHHEAYPYIFMQKPNRTFVPITKDNFDNLAKYETEYLRPGDFNGDGEIDLVGQEPDYLNNKYIIKTFLNSSKHICTSNINFNNDPQKGLWYFKYIINESIMKGEDFTGGKMWGYDVVSLKNGYGEIVDFKSVRPPANLREKLQIKYYPDGEIVAKGMIDFTESGDEYYTILTGSLNSGFMDSRSYSMFSNDYLRIEFIKDSENIFEFMKTDTIEAQTGGLKNKKRGPLKQYDTVIKFSALHHMDIFKYDVYLGMNYSNKTMEFVLPLSKGNSWDIDKDKLKKCKKQSYNDDAVFFKTIENNILNDNNQCLFNTISTVNIENVIHEKFSSTIDQQQIFINFFDDLVNNKKKLFELSINESTDANEKKMIKSKLNILTKESLGLEFKKI